MPRLFTALEMPRDAALSLSLLRGGLPGARWIDVEHYHLTLRFFRDVSGQGKGCVDDSQVSLAYQSLNCPQ